jgi:hypothetical protein
LPTLSEITTFQFVIAIIGIPLVLGFLTEAGKDLWNIIRKKPDTTSYMAICSELRASCRSKEEITRLIKSDEIMLKRQNDLRDTTLPEMKETLVRIEEQVRNMGNDVRDIKTKLNL